MAVAAARWWPSPRPPDGRDARLTAAARSCRPIPTDDQHHRAASSVALHETTRAYSHPHGPRRARRRPRRGESRREEGSLAKGSARLRVDGRYAPTRSTAMDFPSHSDRRPRSSRRTRPRRRDVVVLVADRVDESTRALFVKCDRRTRLGWVLIVGGIDAAPCWAAVEAGVAAIVRRGEATTERLATAIGPPPRATGTSRRICSAGCSNRSARRSGTGTTPQGLTFGGLTQRELTVLSLIAEGYSTSEIAAENGGTPSERSRTRSISGLEVPIAQPLARGRVRSTARPDLTGRRSAGWGGTRPACRVRPTPRPSISVARPGRADQTKGEHHHAAHRWPAMPETDRFPSPAHRRRQHRPTTPTGAGPMPEAGRARATP